MAIQQENGNGAAVHTIDVKPALHDPEDSDHVGSGRKRGMRITFSALDYIVVNSQNKREKISLLSNVNGFFNPGQMSALMGPSGSGKTTLLDVLAGRKTVGETRGQILFAGTPPSGNFLRRYTGYVEQFDTLLDTLTVREMLMYTAELKREVSEPLDAKALAVDTLLEQLALTVCKNVRIGNSLARGISGGQAKRVNIGIALITNPRVLFLDEPTSGLDSYTSNEVMTVVKGLVSTGITICATIHSPTPYAFNLFDRLILLLRGRVVYFGPRDSSMLSYFKALTADAPELEAGQNEAEWIVDITTQADRQGKAGEFGTAYEKSALKARNQVELEELQKQGSNLNSETLKELSVKRATVTPFWSALKTLVKYRTTNNYRNPEFLAPRIGDKLIFSILIFTLYWHVGKDFAEQNITNISAVLFMWTTLPAFGAASYIPAIVLERPLFVRERNDGLYRVITYLMAKLLDELMLAFVASLIFSTIVFYATSMQGQWVLFWLVYFITLSCGIVLAYTIAALSPTMDVANAALPTYVVSLLFFAGFLLRYEDIPNYWKWYSWTDFLKYGWGAQMINQFAGSGATITRDNTEVLEFYSLAGVSKYAAYELCFFFLFTFLAWLCLSYVKHSRR